MLVVDEFVLLYLRAYGVVRKLRDVEGLGDLSFSGGGKEGKPTFEDQREEEEEETSVKCNC